MEARPRELIANHRRFSTSLVIAKIWRRRATQEGSNGIFAPQVGGIDVESAG